MREADRRRQSRRHLQPGRFGPKQCPRRVV
jgi:hypothetical protein